MKVGLCLFGPRRLTGSDAVAGYKLPRRPHPSDYDLIGFDAGGRLFILKSGSARECIEAMPSGYSLFYSVVSLYQALGKAVAPIAPEAIASGLFHPYCVRV